MANIKIRQIAREDAVTLAGITAEIQQLHHQSAPDFFIEAPDDLSAYTAHILAYLERGTGYLAEIEGQTVASVRFEIRQTAINLFTKPYGSLHIDEIGVRSKFRGQGIGHQLMDHVMRDAKKHDVRFVTLNVFHFNTAAIQFYEKLGFQCRNMTMHLQLK